MSEDFELQDEGSLYLLRPLTGQAVEWLDEHIEHSRQMLGTAVVVEHHYVADIVRGIRAEGLEIGLERLSRRMTRQDYMGGKITHEQTW
jgi:hypothetical protein